MAGYWVSSVMWLSLEDYYNAGLTPEEAKQVIELIPDVVGNLDLHCETQFINGNWNVRTRATDPNDLAWLYRHIVLQLDLALADKLRAAQEAAAANDT